MNYINTVKYIRFSLGVYFSMNYRGIFYFFILSIVIYVVAHSKVIKIKKNINMSQNKIFKKFMKIEKNDDIRIVETFIELEPDKKKDISNLSSRDQGRITKDKGYSYYNDIRFVVQEEDKIIKSHEYGDKKNTKNVKKDIRNHKNKVDILPNKYVRKKIIINMNNNGVVSIAAENKEYAKYLMVIAKKIFYNWKDFIPAWQISQKLIKSDKDGYYSGTVGLYFLKNADNNRIDVLMVKHFASENLNKLTLRSFKYLKLPSAPENFKLNFIFVNFTISPNLHVEAQFKFDIYDQNNEKS